MDEEGGTSTDTEVVEQHSCGLLRMSTRTLCRWCWISVRRVDPKDITGWTGAWEGGGDGRRRGARAADSVAVWPFLGNF